MLYRTEWEFGHTIKTEIKTEFSPEWRAHLPKVNTSLLDMKDFSDASWWVNVRPDIESCPVVVGFIPHVDEEGKLYNKPYLKFCKAPSCPRCSGYRASRAEAEYSHLYKIGSKDSWWFLTFSGLGKESHFRHAPLKEQVWTLRRMFNRFVEYMESSMGTLAVGYKLSYIAACEATVNTRKEMDGPHTAQCRVNIIDEETGDEMSLPSHWNAHIHVHIYSPMWDEMCYATRDRGPNGHLRPAFYTSKKGTKIPHKVFRQEMQRVAGLCGFGALDISKLVFDDEDTGRDYIYKSYILKKPPQGSEEWYRQQVNQAFAKQPRWWCGGPFYERNATHNQRKALKKYVYSNTKVALIRGLFSQNL